MKRLLRIVMGIALVAAGAACQDAEISVERSAPRLISIVPSTSCKDAAVSEDSVYVKYKGSDLFKFFFHRWL